MLILVRFILNICYICDVDCFFLFFFHSRLMNNLFESLFVSSLLLLVICVIFVYLLGTPIVICRTYSLHANVDVNRQFMRLDTNWTDSTVRERKRISFNSNYLIQHLKLRNTNKNELSKRKWVKHMMSSHL